MQLRRLTAGDRELAKGLFTLTAEVFEEPAEPLGDAYLDRLLRREDFWALAAFAAGAGVVGGLTAHTLPMARAERSEIFIYDDDLNALDIYRALGGVPSPVTFFTLAAARG